VGYKILPSNITSRRHSEDLDGTVEHHTKWLESKLHPEVKCYLLCYSSNKIFRCFQTPSLFFICINKSL